MEKEDIDYIINVLRRGTITWKGRTECINRKRRLRVVGQFKNGKDKMIYERPCDACGTYYDLKEGVFEVDHIVEIGSFNGNWDDFVRKVYCGQENLQALCIPCHAKKTARFNSTHIYTRKNKNNEIVEDTHDYLALL